VRVEVARHGTRATPLPSAVDRAAYRIVQEALTNVLKHGTDGTASVTIDDAGDAIAIRVTNPVAAPRRWVARLGAPSALGSRMGVIGVRERAALLGGRAFVGPTADGRWLVDVTLPVSGPTS
jgi:signal transduction histidine kinase